MREKVLLGMFSLIVMLLLLVSITEVNAEEITYEYFTFDTETGTITDYQDTEPETAIIIHRDVKIPREINGVIVTAIGGSAFNFSGITSVSIPDTVTTIGYGAFHDCTSLSSINVDSDNNVFSSKDGVLFDKSQTEIIQYP